MPASSLTAVAGLATTSTSSAPAIGTVFAASLKACAVSRAVVRFYNERGMAEQRIKVDKQAVKMTRLNRHRFRSNQLRLWLSILAYDLGNLWRRLVLPQKVEKWLLTSLQQRLVKTGGGWSNTPATTGCCWQRAILRGACLEAWSGGEGN